MAKLYHTKHVTCAQNWLANAARSEASNLPSLIVETGSDLRQLILVRYTTELHKTAFVHDDLKEYGAMWTDAVTTNSEETELITGMNYGAQWKGLQVVRLSLPADFEVGDEDCFDCKLSSKKCRLGTEYFVRFDIPCGYFSNIPFEYDYRTRSFRQPHVYTIPTIGSAANQLPSF